MKNKHSDFQYVTSLAVIYWIKLIYVYYICSVLFYRRYCSRAAWGIIRYPVKLCAVSGREKNIFSLSSMIFFWHVFDTISDFSNASFWLNNAEAKIQWYFRVICDTLMILSCRIYDMPVTLSFRSLKFSFAFRCPRITRFRFVFAEW